MSATQARPDLKPIIVASPTWNRLAISLLQGYAPPVIACKQCNYPVIKGYCCTFCGTGDTRTQAKATPPHDAIGRLPLYACHHWTGYGIDSELCRSYLKVLSALKAAHRLLSVEHFDTSDGLVSRCEEIAKLAEAAIQSAEEEPNA